MRCQPLSICITWLDFSTERERNYVIENKYDSIKSNQQKLSKIITIIIIVEYEEKIKQKPCLWKSMESWYRWICQLSKEKWNEPITQISTSKLFGNYIALLWNIRKCINFKSRMMKRVIIDGLSIKIH